MMDSKKIKWYDSGNQITNLIIGVIFVIIISSQSFAVGEKLSLQLLGSIINHNSIYLFVLVYFIFIKFKFGKKYFNYLNVGLFFIYFIATFTSMLTVVQSFSLDSLLDFVLSLFILIYMLHTLFRDTRVWKEFKLYTSPFNELSNDWLFYSIVLISFTLLIINLISTVVLSGVVISILDTIYVILFGRYIYLYRDYLDKNKIDSDNSGNFDAIKDTIKTTVGETTDMVKNVIEDAKIDEKLNDAKDAIVDTATDVVDGTTKFIKDNEIDKKVDDLKNKIDDTFDEIVDDIREKVGDIEDKVDEMEEESEEKEEKKTKSKKTDNSKSESKTKSTKKEKGDK